MNAYHVTEHAKIRAAERFNVPLEHASNHLNQLMQTAEFVGYSQNKYGSVELYVHQRKNTRLVVAKNKNLIVTVSPVSAKWSEPFAQANAVDIAQIDLELAQLRLEAAKLAKKIRETEARKAAYL